MKLMFAAAAVALMTPAAPAAAAVALMTPATPASTTGTTLTCASTTFTCSASSASQGTGMEFAGKISGLSLFGFDFSDGLLTVTNPLGGDWGFAGKASFRFGSSAVGFGTATLLSNTGFSGVSQANFGVANGVLTFAPGVISASRDARLTLRLDPVGAVPEPASWAMMLLGFGMMGYALRRRGQASRAMSLA